LGCLHQRVKLCGTKEKRLGAAGRGDEIAFGNLGLGQRGPEIRQEASRHTQALGGATGTAFGRGGTGPIDSQLSPNGARDVSGFKKLDEVPQQGAFDPHLKPQRLSKAEI
jgi:hypothetical protein